MQSNRRRDTSLELSLRSALHRTGLRFRVDARPILALNRRADVVFRPARVAVFAHGCFWHGCDEHFKLPHTNPNYWSEKIATNRLRYSETLSTVTASGWELPQSVNTTCRTTANN